MGKKCLVSGEAITERPRKEKSRVGSSITRTGEAGGCINYNLSHFRDTVGAISEFRLTIKGRKALRKRAEEK